MIFSRRNWTLQDALRALFLKRHKKGNKLGKRIDTILSEPSTCKSECYRLTATTFIPVKLSIYFHEINLFSEIHASIFPVSSCFCFYEGNNTPFTNQSWGRRISKLFWLNTILTSPSWHYWMFSQQIGTFDSVIPEGGQSFRNVRQVGSTETFRLKQLKALQVRNILFHRRLKWMNQENPLVSQFGMISECQSALSNSSKQGSFPVERDICQPRCLLVRFVTTLRGLVCSQLICNL